MMVTILIKILYNKELFFMHFQYIFQLITLHIAPLFILSIYFSQESSRIFQ